MDTAVQATVSGLIIRRSGTRQRKPPATRQSFKITPGYRVGDVIISIDEVVRIVGAPAFGWVAVLLIVPGTFLSVALGGIGLALGVVWIIGRARTDSRPEALERPHPAVSALAGVLSALALGALIGLIAWVI